MEDKDLSQLMKMFRYAQGDRERATEFAAKHHLDVNSIDTLTDDQWETLHHTYVDDHDKQGLESGDLDSFKENVKFNLGVVENYLKYPKK